MKKAILFLFVLLFAAASVLLYFKLSEKPSLAESLESGRQAFASKALLSFTIEENLISKSLPREPLRITLKGQGEERSYRLRGRASFLRSRKFALRRTEGTLRIRPATTSPLLPGWIKNWTSNSRLLLAQLVFSPEAQKRVGQEKKIAGQEVLFYPLRENFVKNLISENDFLGFKKGAIAFSRENDLPLYLRVSYQGRAGGGISNIEKIKQDITLWLDWQVQWSG